MEKSEYQDLKNNFFMIAMTTLLFIFSLFFVFYPIIVKHIAFSKNIKNLNIEIEGIMEDIIACCSSDNDGLNFADIKFEEDSRFFYSDEQAVEIIRNAASAAGLSVRQADIDRSGAGALSVGDVPSADWPANNFKILLADFMLEGEFKDFFIFVNYLYSNTDIYTDISRILIQRDNSSGTDILKIDLRIIFYLSG